MFALPLHSQHITNKNSLSTKKKSNHPGNTSMTPRRILHHSPVYVHVPSNDTNAVVLPLNRRPSTPTEEDLTPKNNITRLGLVDPTNNNNNSTTSINTLRTKEHQHSSSVKFGNNTAAEFDSTLPITEMTPIPSSVVQQIFPLELLDVQNVQKQQEEYGVSRETARNVALLAEWDDDFDEIIVGGDNGGEAPSRGRSGRSRRGQKRHTPYKLTGGRRNSSARRPRKERRRESSIFSRGGGSLVDPIIDNDDDDNTAMDDSAGGATAAAATTTNNGNGLNDSMEMDESLTHDAINDINGHSSAAISGRRNRRRRGGSASRGSAGSGGRDSLLPLSVTIGPEEYTSPSSASMSTLGSTPSVATENDELEQPTATSSAGGGGNDDVRRESLESACISPNSSLAAAASATTAVGKPSKNNPNNGTNNGSNRRESNASCCSSSTTTSGKETPNSARRSSSTILRAVHADGGAVLVAVTGAAGSNNGGLQPNQLKYSPSGSSGGSSSSSSSTLRMVSCCC